MAQQVEHVLGKDEVTGSSPVSSSTNIPARRIKIRRAGFSFVGRFFVRRVVFRSSGDFSFVGWVFVRRVGFRPSGGFLVEPPTVSP